MTNSTFRSLNWERNIGISSVPDNTSCSTQATACNTHKKSPSSCLNVTKDYCDNTTIHGVKYIGTDDVFIMERILWLVCFIASLTGAILFVRPILKRYSNNQLMTTIQSTDTPIWDVAFPAVTICNVNKVMKNLYHNATAQEPWKNSPHMDKVMKLLSGLGEMRVTSGGQDEEDIKQFFDKNVNATDRLMRDVVQPIEWMALSCYWMGTKSDCSQLFESRRTDYGYCWSFNSKKMKDKQEITNAILGINITTEDSEAPTEEDLITDKEESLNIRRVNGPGPILGLTVLLSPESENAGHSTAYVNGFKVLIHDPSAFPTMASRSFLVSGGREIFASVTPTITSSTHLVRQIPKNKRFCYFQDEKHMTLYKTYSYDNCILECKIRTMINHCNCVPYIYSMFSGVDGVKVCNYSGMKCVNEHLRMLSSIKPDVEVKGLEPGIMSMENCTCKPKCDDLRYETDISEAVYKLDQRKLANITDLLVTNPSELVLLRVFFKEMMCTTYLTDLVYKWTDLLSTFGGLVNLFTGFSFISACEVLYFFVLCPLFRICMRPKTD